jgi:hypothetical protein
MEIPAGQDKIDLIFKNSILDLPILRKYIKGKGTTKEPIPKYAFTQILRVILKKVAHFVGATIHAIKRFLSKKIDGELLSSKLLSSPYFFLWKTDIIRAYRLADVLIQRDIRKYSVKCALRRYMRDWAPLR